MNNLDDNQSGRCWGCGYLLRGVESAKCPECGKAFDRANRESMNFGRSMGRMGRWMVGRMGWWPIALSFIGAVLVLCTTRWPVRGWRFSLVDLKFYANLLQWRERTPGFSAIDAAYTAGLLFSAVAILWLILRGMLRTAGVIIFRPPAELRGRFWRRTFLTLILLAFAFAGIGVGWPYRLGQRWTREWEATAGPTFTPQNLSLYDVVTADVPLRAVVIQGTASQRRAGIKMIGDVVFDPDYEWKIFRDVFASENVLENKVLALRIAGTLWYPELEPLMARELSDRSSEVRTAAADALSLYRGGNARWSAAPPPAELPQRLESMMFQASDLEERQAAARALVLIPVSGYQFRYAEWGVMIGEGKDKIRFTQALKDDVPPFVHRIGNPISEFESRIGIKSGGMGKPVIHLTVDRPMAVELTVCMNDGRPWVAYPAFDDLILLEGTFGNHERGPDDRQFGPLPSIRLLDPKGMQPLTDLREGYPWDSPRHRKYDWFDPTGSYQGGRRDLEKLSTVCGMGMLWQSLIVTPEKTSFTRLAEIPAEARFDWWRKLRDVPCSWVTSRGESERFLYYDGPTIMPAPIAMRVEGDKLKWSSHTFERNYEPFRPEGIVDDKSSSAIYIEVRGGRLKGFWIDQEGADDNSQEIPPILKPIKEADFTARLVKHGLNEAEANAMVSCWKKQFFETDGRRTLVIISQADYETICPMSVRPWPTKIARVGVVWTELSNK